MAEPRHATVSMADTHDAPSSSEMGEGPDNWSEEEGRNSSMLLEAPLPAQSAMASAALRYPESSELLPSMEIFSIHDDDKDEPNGTDEAIAAPPPPNTNKPPEGALSPPLQYEHKAHPVHPMFKEKAAFLEEGINDADDLMRVKDDEEDERAQKSDGGSKKSRSCFWVLLPLVALALGTLATILSILSISDEEKVVEQVVVGDNEVIEISQVDVSVLDEVFERGFIRCGFSFEQPGFFLQFGGTSENPSYIGFDLDVCRIISSAIFGDPEKYEAIVIPPEERFAAIAQDKTVDVIFRTTFTMQRDVYVPSIGVGLHFSIPYYYDGLGFGGIPEFVECADNLDTNSTACGDLQICVVAQTTHLDIIEDLFAPEFITVVNTQPELYNGLPETCNVIAGEGAWTAPEIVSQQGYQGPYVAGTTMLSSEPQGLATREGDTRWSDFLEWIMQALIYAEEVGITRDRAFLMPTTELFGEQFEAMFQNVVEVRGNYGELYAHNLAPFYPRAGMNQINTGNSPLLFPIPFGGIDIVGPKIEDISPTVRAIKKRGFLNCGVNLRRGYAVFDNEALEWSGFDVDLCRAIAAALFDGVPEIVFTNLPAAQRFDVLAKGNVDILARLTTLTFGRDVKEPTTEKGYSFSFPYFQDGLTFGGIPPYSNCADNLDVFSPECQALRICLLQTSTFFDIVADLLDEIYIVPVATFADVVGGLSSGACNVIGGGLNDVRADVVKESGYSGVYEVGVNRFSRDPLALTTREDDFVWSDFVRWIFYALLYAEENDISQETADEMPNVDLFGPLRSNAFKHAVNAVGNYAEMYERNFGMDIPRGGLNLLNDVNGPQLRSNPGF